MPIAPINRISNYNLARRKFSEPRIGLTKHFWRIVLLDNPVKRQSAQRVTSTQLRRSYQGEQFAYFVPGSVDPRGNAKIPRTCTMNDLTNCDEQCNSIAQNSKKCNCYTIEAGTWIWQECGGKRYPHDIQVAEAECTPRLGGTCFFFKAIPPTAPGGCWHCHYHCRGTDYFAGYQYVMRYQPHGCHGTRKTVLGWFLEKDCKGRAKWPFREGIEEDSPIFPYD